MDLKTLNLKVAGAEEAARLADARRLIADGDERERGFAESGPPLIVRARRTARSRLAGRLLLVFAARFADANGRTVETEIVGVLVGVEGWPGVAGARSRWTRALVETAASIAKEHVSRSLTRWSEDAIAISAAVSAARVSRGRRILERLASDRPLLFQAGLFDTRAERTRAASADAAAEQNRAISARLRQGEESPLSLAAPDLILVLTP